MRIWAKCGLSQFSKQLLILQISSNHELREQDKKSTFKNIHLMRLINKSFSEGKAVSYICAVSEITMTPAVLAFLMISTKPVQAIRTYIINDKMCFPCYMDMTRLSGCVTAKNSSTRSYTTDVKPRIGLVNICLNEV